MNTEKNSALGKFNTEKKYFDSGKSKLFIISLLFLCCFFSLFNNSSPLYAQWVPTNGPSPGASVRCIAVSGSNLLAGSWGGLNGYSGGAFISANNGANWLEINSGLTDTAVFAFATNGGYIFAGTYGGGVFRSADNGVNWSSAGSGLTNPVINAFAVIGSNLFAGTYDGVFVSANNGANWISAGLPGFFTLALAVNGTDLFEGSDGDGVYRSTNNGLIWTAVNSGLTNNRVLALAVSGTNLYAGTHSGVFRSTNNGANWTNTAGLSGSIINTMAVSGVNVFAGDNSGGVFLSTNNGANWTAVGTGLPNSIINTLAVSGANIFAGALNGVVYRRALSEMITSVQLLSNDLPVNFKLSQNYPNPFNPVTMIKYQLPKATYLTIKLYDQLGRETLAIYEGNQQAGYYQATVDGTNLASGIYYCRITAEGFTKVIKMSLIK